MLVPLEWLREHCAPDLPTQELAERLEMTGTEVGGIAARGVGGAHERFVVGRVLTAEQHPDADRLKVCTVDVGEAEPAHIVCGAPNVAAGQTVAVARPGAIMPGGIKLKKAKLRGQVSEGMILAEDELDIGTDHAGIIVLAEDGLRAGQPLSDVLPLGTDVLDLEPTPNRPDELGIYGVAREVHAATGAPLGPEPWADDPGSFEGDLPVEITVEAPDLCPRFTARVFEDVRIGPSPPWLKARLTAAGQRPINNVVDITKYVMLLTGQPLHAFDLDRVAGGRLVVRRAQEGEQVTTLDGQVRTLTAEDCLIADGDGPTSIAGIMGGEHSEVAEGTTRVLLEAANWHGPAIDATSARLVLRSEASARYEKGLPPESTLEAQAIATRLLVNLAGARLVPGTIDIDNVVPARREPQTIRTREARVERLLGIAIPRAEQIDHLEALGFGVAEAPDGLDVVVPYWRREDVTREADVIEEIARLHDVNANLPATLPSRNGAVGVLTPAQRLRRRAEDVLVGRGLYEIAGWSFAERSLLDRLRLPGDSPLREVVEVDNPMSEAQAILRPTIVGSLLDAAAANVARGARDLGLFESASVYRASATEPSDEHHALAALLTGRLAPGDWNPPAGESATADFFTAKALVEAVLDTLRVPWRTEPAGWPFLHPGRSAAVLTGDVRLGFVGEVHPLVARTWDMEGPVAVFALDLGKVAAAAPESTVYADVVSFPPLRQDLAVILPAGVAAGRAADVIREAGGALLARADVFDVYTGAQVGEGRRSLAFALTFRAGDRTLTDEDVAPVRERIVGALRDELEVSFVGETVMVAGASGYAGALAARIVHRHPHFELAAVTARSDVGVPLSELYPHHRVPLVLEELDLDRHGDVDAAIVGYPHAASAPVVAELRRRGVRVIDLSADFRLRDRATYEQWYGEHKAPELFGTGVYGLPERYREQIAEAGLVAGPGCFPTAAILGLAPLGGDGLVADVVIDAKSGVSGAGRAANQTTHFVSVDENVAAYKIDGHRHAPEIDQELRAAGAPVTCTFTPHLLPLDQGELLSCYVTTTRRVSRQELEDRYAAAYADEPFIEVTDASPGVRDVRETNLCRIKVHSEPRTGKVHVFAAIDNLWKGTSSQAVQSLNLMFGRPETEGLGPLAEAKPAGVMRVSAAPGPSRWSTVHPHVTPAPDGLLPGGFRAAGVAAGIKAAGLDLGLIVSVEPDTTSAARFTSSSMPAAPVELCRRRARLDAIRTIVANSGNANAATGNFGFEQAAKVQGAAGLVGGVREDQVAVASTGVIGVQLDGAKIIRGLTRANDELRRDGAADFADAIRTTDAFAKTATVDVALPSGTVRVTAQAKGAGMIQPGFATMLCFVQTDAVLAPETADLLLGVCVKRSFERISVDGQLSTNDTVILQASGASDVHVAPESEDELRFGEALDAILRDLALLIVRDGEGAGRVGRVVVRGGDGEAAERAARAVANSPLVKTALHGGDPNWGRIAQAVGAALPGSALPIDIAIEGVTVCRAGAAARFALADLERAVAREEVEYEVTLPGEGAETEVFFSDLGHGYVTINADYTT